LTENLFLLISIDEEKGRIRLRQKRVGSGNYDPVLSDMKRMTMTFQQEILTRIPVPLRINL